MDVRYLRKSADWANRAEGVVCEDEDVELRLDRDRFSDASHAWGIGLDSSEL
jgi:hypothetical protein